MPPTPGRVRGTLRFLRLETPLVLLGAFFVNLCVICVFAQGFYGTGEWAAQLPLRGTAQLAAASRGCLRRCSCEGLRAALLRRALPALPVALSNPALGLNRRDPCFQTRRLGCRQLVTCWQRSLGSSSRCSGPSGCWLPAWCAAWAV